MKVVGLSFCVLLFCIGVIAQTPAPSPSPAAEVIDVSTPDPAPHVTDEPSIADWTKQVLSVPYVRPDAKTRRKRFANSVVGPFALGRTVATAGLSTWTNSPEEWGTKWEGFGRRVASNFGKNAIKQVTKFGLDEALKIDSHFYRSKSPKVGDRIRNALISPVTARDKNGKRVFGVSNIAGTYTSSIVAYEAWYPARYDWKNGLRSGTISLGFNAAFNLFKEFVWTK